jgi:hypothetical protein
MSIAFLLLGKTNVAFYDATAAERISDETPAGGVIGAFDDLTSVVDTGGPQAVFTMDVSVSESHSLQSDITEHPVETGSDISDHIRNRPRVLSIQGLVTDTPSGILALAIVPGLIDRFASIPRSIQIFQEIERNWVNKKTFDIVTGLKVYKNMGLVSVVIPRTAERGRGLQFEFQLKEINFVSSETRQAGTLDGGDPDTNLGSRVPSTVP